VKQFYPRSSSRRACGVRALLDVLEPRRLLHAGHSGIYINAGGPTVVDGAGHTWLADVFFVGGEAKPASFDVIGTGDDAIYASRRFGETFAYNIPVAAGRYGVSLLFAEPWFTRQGERVFDVTAEGTNQLSRFDVNAAVAPRAAVSRSFEVAVNDGALNLEFSSTKDAALIAGIAVERIASAPPTAPVTPGTVRSPFGNAPVRLPATIEAENFDNGDNGVSFNDVTEVNAGGMYRETAVDIYPINSTLSLGTALYGVGSIRAGEWAEYTIEAPYTGIYTLELRFASGSRGGRGQVLLDGVPWASDVSFASTGGWSVFSNIGLGDKQITAGTHVLRVQFDAATARGEEIGVLDQIKISNAGGGPIGPIVPTRFAARGVGDTQVNLSWDDNSTNEQAYIVQRKLDGDESFVTIATLNPNTEYFVDPAVAPNTTYVYRVAALNPDGGGLSNEIRLTTWVADRFRWKGAAANPLARYESVGAAANGRLFVFGGYVNEQIQSTARVDAYDPASNKWTQLGDMPEPVTHAGQAVDGRYIYIAGGFLGDHPGLGTTSVWRYDTTGDRWDRMPSLPEPRGAGAMARWGTQLHFFGGLTKAQFATVNQAEHWVLDLTNPLRGWKQRASLPNARNHLAAAELNGKIYAIGGQDLWNELTGARDNVDAYDPKTDSWTPAAALPVARSHTSASTFSLNGKIYVVGGATNGFKTLRDVTTYDPTTNSWTAFRELTAPRLTPVAGAIGKMLIVSTGSAYGLKPQGETFFGLLD